MDFLVIVILMAVLYIVPELLKRRRMPERYEYPTIPLPSPTEVKAEKTEAAPEKLPERKLWTGQGTLSEETPSVDRTKTMEESSLVPGRFTQEALIHGFIFAEIIRPPRAYRPMRRRL